MSLLALAVAALAARVSAVPISNMFGRKLQVTNFEGRAIPTGLGLSVFAGVFGGVLMSIVIGGLGYVQGLTVLFWAAMVVLAGLLDDTVGDHRSRGFRGHFSAFFRGELTTGMAKVFLVSLGALLSTWPWTWFSPLDWLLLLLAVNLFNQLDLRPGRSAKVYIILSIPLYLLAGGPGGWLAGIGLGASLGVLGGDLQGRWMLGDTGANLLGAVAGLSVLLALPVPGRLLATSGLVLLNLAGELWSLNRIIEGNLFLRTVDNWGRNRGDRQRIK